MNAISFKLRLRRRDQKKGTRILKRTEDGLKAIGALEGSTNRCVVCKFPIAPGEVVCGECACEEDYE